MGVFRRLHDYLATDIEVAFQVAPAESGTESWVYESGHMLNLRTRVWSEVSREVARFVFLGGLPSFPVHARVTSPDGAGFKVVRRNLGLVEVTAFAPGTQPPASFYFGSSDRPPKSSDPDRQPMRAAFYLDIGERYVCRNPYGPDLIFRRYRHRDQPPPFLTAS